MKRDPFGTYVQSTTMGEAVRAFVPPLLAISTGSQRTLDRALLTGAPK